MSHSSPDIASAGKRCIEVVILSRRARLLDSLDDCQTESDVLDWTLHLLQKNWFQATDWPEMVQKARAGRARNDFPA